MYKELATIKDGDKVTGFVVYDGASTIIMNIDRAKKEAATGNIDTLGYKDGRFIPIIQGEIADELGSMGKRISKRIADRARNMTFGEFVSYDCIINKQDIDLMFADRNIVLASVCTVLETKVKDEYMYMMTMAFYSPHPGTIAHVRKSLMTYAPKLKTISSARSYNNFIIVNLPLKDRISGFDLLAFGKGTGLNFLYNFEMMNNMKDRVDHTIQYAPFLTKIMMKAMMPTDEGIIALIDILKNVNKDSSDSFIDIQI